MSLSYDPKNTKAILIGTSKYVEPCFNNILPVEGNITDFEDILRDTNIIGLSDENIVKLFNKTHKEIYKIIREIVSDEANINLNTLIVYYAGHGYRRREDRKLYLTGTNSDINYIHGTSVAFNDIKNLIENSQIQKRIIFIDACHSGLAVMGQNEFYQENELDINGTYVITSCPGNESALFDQNDQNTFFTGELLKYIKHGYSDTNKFLTLDSCFSYLKKKLKERNLPQPQRKTNLNSPEDFNFAKNTNYNPEKNNIDNGNPKKNKSKGTKWKRILIAFILLVIMVIIVFFILLITTTEQRAYNKAFSSDNPKKELELFINDKCNNRNSKYCNQANSTLDSIYLEDAKKKNVYNAYVECYNKRCTGRDSNICGEVRDSLESPRVKIVGTWKCMGDNSNDIDRLIITKVMKPLTIVFKDNSEEYKDEYLLKYYRSNNINNIQVTLYDKIDTFTFILIDFDNILKMISISDSSVFKKI